MNDTDAALASAGESPEQGYCSLFEHHPDGIFKVDREGCFLSVNAAAERISGYSLEEFAGRPFAPLVAPDQVALTLACFHRVLQGVPQRFETALIHRNGHRVELRITAVPEIRSGEVVGVYGIAHDFTEQKRTRDTLSSRALDTAGVVGAEFFPMLVRELATALGVRYALVTTRVEGSEDRMRVLGFWSGDRLERSLEYSLPGTPCEQVLLTGETVYYPCRVAEFFPEHQLLVRLEVESYLGVPLRDGSGRCLGHLCVLDVQPLARDEQSEAIIRIFATRAAAELQRLDMERALLRSEERHRALVCSSTTVVWTADAQGRSPEVDAWMEAFTGLKRGEEAPPVWWLSALHPDDQPRIVSWAEALRCRKNFSSELRVRHAAGNYRYLSLRSIPLWEADGTFREWVGTLTDVTDRREAEEALRESRYLAQRIADICPAVVYIYDLFTESCLYTNCEVAAALGVDRDYLKALGSDMMPALMHPDDLSRFTDYLQRLQTLADGETATFEYRMRHSDGSWRWFHSRDAVFARDGEGRVTQTIGSALDITARKQMEDAREFLSEAGAVLSSSLDFQVTLNSLTRLCVPRLADYCLIYESQVDGSLRQVAQAHVDPERELLLECCGRLHQPERNHPGSVVSQAARTGEPVMLSEVPDGLIDAITSDPEVREIFHRVTSTSVMALPLSVRNETIGVLYFATAESGRRYDRNDLHLARRLATRAALSLDNARLYRHQKEIAQTLQQSLLPPRLPRIPRLDLAACYRPAYDGVEVGGDFYDLFELPDQSWTVIIGDVTGKGPAAAALTSLLRYTVRAVAMRAHTPSRVLTQLNETLLRDVESESFCTATCAHLRQAGNGVRLTVSCGGHPPALVLDRRGRVRSHGRPGVLLGAFPGMRFSDQSVRLGPGDTVVLYTDGVLEARVEGELFGMERLEALLAECSGLGAQAIATRIEQAVLEFQQGIPRDDIAILVLQLQPA